MPIGNQDPMRAFIPGEDLHPAPHSGARQLLTWCIAFALMALGLLWIAGLTERARIAEASRPKYEAALARSGTCAVPPRTGDKLVITVEQTGTRLVFVCKTLTNWREPERISP